MSALSAICIKLCISTFISAMDAICVKLCLSIYKSAQGAIYVNLCRFSYMSDLGCYLCEAMFMSAWGASSVILWISI